MRPVACSNVPRASRGLHRSVCPFGVTVEPVLSAAEGVVLYAGFHLDGCCAPMCGAAWNRSRLGLPVNQRRQGLDDDASIAPLLVVTRSHSLGAVATSGS